jgi:hypothetical protein
MVGDFPQAFSYVALINTADNLENIRKPAEQRARYRTRSPHKLLGAQGLEPTYGAAASLAALLVWIYYSEQIVLFGADSATSPRYGVRAAREERVEWGWPCSSD